jgi:hypothetical protein
MSGHTWSSHFEVAVYDRQTGALAARRAREFAAVQEAIGYAKEVLKSGGVARFTGRGVLSDYERDAIKHSGLPFAEVLSPVMFAELRSP